MLRTKLTLSTLATVMLVAGCSTQMVQPTAQKDVSATKVEAVKVNPNVIDLGEKNGSTANVRLGFNNKSPFGIKAGTVFDATAFLTNTGRRLQVKLHKYAAPFTKTAAEDPADRFADMGLAFATEIPITGSNVIATTNLTFRGLKVNTDYLVSARAYVDMPLSASQLQISDLTSTGDVTLSGGSIDNAKTLYIEPGDEIMLDDDGAGTNPAKFYRVNSITTPTTFNISYSGTGFSATNTDATMFARNVTAIGNKGAVDLGQGNGTGSDKGGGTAGGDGTTSTEEMIHVDNTGAVSIINDVATANNILDIKLQLRSTFTPDQPGAVQVIPGGDDSLGETITSP